MEKIKNKFYWVLQNFFLIVLATLIIIYAFWYQLTPYDSSYSGFGFEHWFASAVFLFLPFGVLAILQKLFIKKS
jgi:1,4-dihydroxy-2-naphthoate octaprenyltransferase